jgi:endonuclease/exonuclease/phosphatase family metal-dependent hydrolase
MMRKKYLLIAITAFASTTSCSDSSNGVTIDTLNVALAGAFIEYEDERREPLAEAIANADSDIICLQEVFEQSDKEMIRDAARESFPHAWFFENDLNTELDDPEDQNGEIPPDPPEDFVPCPDIVPDNATMGETIEDQMNAAIDCVADNCSTTGDDQGQFTGLDCAVSQCFTKVLPLATGDAQQQQCYACAVTQLPTVKLADIRDSCSTVGPNQNLSYDGQNGLMILSRYPLSNEENWVIPGTWTRRVINRATATLPDGKELDIYCNHLTPIFSNPAFVYTGQYGGDGMSSEERWEAEQFLQAQKLIDYVERRSGESPAVILGDLNSGHGFTEADIVAEGEPTLDLLEEAFTPAYPADYEPLCTYCGDNPLIDAETSVWIDQILLHQLDRSVVRSTERTFDEPSVEVDTPDGAMLIPLSDHYGIRSVIELP